MFYFNVVTQTESQLTDKPGNQFPQGVISLKCLEADQKSEEIAFAVSGFGIQLELDRNVV